MTELRDQFAMAALTGILANPDESANYELITMSCYRCADAMLKARGLKRTKEPTVDDLDLSVRTANFLKLEGIETIAHLRSIGADGIRKKGATAKMTKEIFEEIYRSGK